MEARKRELGRLRQAIPPRVGMQVLLFATPTLAAVFSFAAYGSAEPGNFTAPHIFSAIAYFSIMRFPLVCPSDDHAVPTVLSQSLPMLIICSLLFSKSFQLHSTWHANGPRSVLSCITRLLVHSLLLWEWVRGFRDFLEEKPSRPVQSSTILLHQCRRTNFLGEIVYATVSFLWITVHRTQLYFLAIQSVQFPVHPLVRSTPLGSGHEQPDIHNFLFGQVRNSDCCFHVDD